MNQHKPFGCVYLLRNLNDGKVYVGQTTRPVGERWAHHCSDARKGRIDMPVCCAIRQNGPAAFVVNVLAIAASQDELNQLESYYVRLFESRDPKYGYNIRAGGDRRLPPESRRKIAEANRAHRIGQHWPDQIRARMSASQFARWKRATPEEKAQHGQRAKGRKHSAVARRRMSEATDTPERVARRKTIIHMRNAGATWTVIGHSLGVHRETVREIYNRYAPIYEAA